MYLYIHYKYEANKVENFLERVMILHKKIEDTAVSPAVA